MIKALFKTFIFFATVWGGAAALHNLVPNPNDVWYGFPAIFTYGICLVVTLGICAAGWAAYADERR